MAQCKQGPQDFIKNAFTPQIAVMCTPLAEKSCEKNNLTFIELLQPFSRLTNDLCYKEPTGSNVKIRNLKLTFLDINTRPPQTVLARKLLNSSVSEAPEPRNTLFEVGEYKLDIPSSTPWFENWRDTFLKVQYPSDHEFTKHFLACLLIVSSSDNNPVETMVRLAQSLNHVQASGQEKLPKWFSSNIIKYYVILHDTVEGNATIAHEAFESLKVSYGAANCFLLRMNSRPPGVSDKEHLPDPWSQFLNNQIDAKELKGVPDTSPYSAGESALEIGQEANEIKPTNYHPLSPDTNELLIDTFIEKGNQPVKTPRKKKTHGSCLSVNDVEQVKLLVFEFSRSCLLPYVEKQMAILNDVISNKKGMSKSLFSATKRWFSPNKPGASSVAVNNLVYAADSPELQVRKLGDLFFMFGNYSSAFQAYHLAKRDYNADQAWLYYAGALEMAALSAFMANESSRKTFDYMEESITTYLNTCKLPQFATRATILSSECLKYKGLHGEAALELIRMTSEESDLRSALLLEQAAYCFTQSKMIRKYAFHMILAGHRFSKAAQRRHSLRCYKQGYQVYQNVGWDLASDHIHYTIGRQANNLQHFEEAVASFSKLLKGGSKQSAQQQAIFLKEYLTILDNKIKSATGDVGFPVLPVPELDNSTVKVLVGPTRPLSTPGKIAALGINFNNDDAENELKWNKLEEMLICEADGAPPLIFKPMITLYTVGKLEKNNPFAIINEPIQFFVEIINSLQTVLALKDVYLLWSFSSESGTVSNEFEDRSFDSLVKSLTVKSVMLQGNTKQDLILSVTPLNTGNLTILGVCYTLCGSTSTTDLISIKGKKLFEVSTSTKPQIPISIKIVPSAPCLQVTFSEMNLDFLSNEIERISVDFQNTGSVPLTKIFVATSVPDLISSCEFQTKQEILVLTENDPPTVRDKILRKNHITSVPLKNGALESGQSTSVNMWVKAPNKKGPARIDLLIYYEHGDKKSIPKYRLVRHSWNLKVQESIAVDISSQSSYNSSKNEELALAVKTTNLNKTHDSFSTEVTLLNVALYSKKWELMTNVATPKYINLQSQESAHILLKAERRNHKESHYSQITLNSDKTSINHLTNAFKAFAKKSEQRAVNAFHEDDISIKENKDGILLLQWQALVRDAGSKRVVYGQSTASVVVNRNEDQIQLDRLLSDTLVELKENTINVEENMEIAQKQVSYNLIHTPVVEHDFEKEKFCIVPITLYLHSISENTVSVIINTLNNSMSGHSHSNLFYSNASDTFSWLGNGNTVKTLQALRTDSMRLAVVVANPGTFDLGSHIQIFCSRSDKSDPPVLQSCQIHSALIVVNTHS